MNILSVISALFNSFIVTEPFGIEVIVLQLISIIKDDLTTGKVQVVGISNSLSPFILKSSTLLVVNAEFKVNSFDISPMSLNAYPLVGHPSEKIVSFDPIVIK